MYKDQLAQTFEGDPAVVEPGTSHPDHLRGEYGIEVCDVKHQPAQTLICDPVDAVPDITHARAVGKDINNKIINNNKIKIINKYKSVSNRSSAGVNRGSIKNINLTTRRNKAPLTGTMDQAGPETRPPDHVPPPPTGDAMAHPGQGVPTREGGRVGGELICARVCNDNGKKGDILALTKGEGGKKLKILSIKIKCVKMGCGPKINWRLL